MRRGHSLALCACLLLLAAGMAAWGQLDFYKQPYLQNASTSGIVIMWETTEAADSRVDYGPTSAYGSYVYDPTPVTMHEMVIGGLDSDSLYHYKATSGSISSADSTFETAFIGSTPFRFAAYGDSRSYPSDHAAVVNAIIASDPRFVLHTGDFVSRGGSESNWQTEFFTPAAPLLKDTCLYPTLGNHEEHASYYFLYFCTPPGGGIDNEQWYSFDYGNCHFVAVDTDDDFSTGSAQYNWLVNDLQSATGEWLFVYTHYPAYSSGSHGGREAVQDYLVPLFEQYAVDMVFAGHDHLYEQSYKDGVYYITTGGGGADLYSCGSSPNPYSQYCESAYHHCTIDVSGLSAVMKARHNDGSVFDEVTLAHGPSAPIADFSGEPTAGNPPLLVQFTDESSGMPDTWSWDFGDTGGSTQQHPSHTYQNLGDYTVSLEVSNAYGSDTETKVDYISVVNYACHVGSIAMSDPGPPKYRATATITVHDQGCAPLDGVSVDVAWSGCVSGSDSGTTNASGQASFTSPRNKSGGEFTCCVTGLTKSGYPYNSGANHETCDTIYNPGAQPPVADFVGNPTSGEAPLTVYFTDQSTNSPTSWSWTFGDGGTATVQNPSHGYTSGGSYTVSLEACNSGGCDTETKPDYITVTVPQPPAAEFVGSPTSGNAPLTVSFTDQSTNSPTSWSWNFGDTGTSAVQNPSHEYTSGGQYTVSLEACNSVGCDTETKPDYITVTEGQPPVADFVGDPTTGAVPLDVTFTDQSTNSPTSWSWNFGDTGTSAQQNPTHQYTSAGTYTVSLTAVNPYGQDTETKPGYIDAGNPPAADFVGSPTAGCATLTVTFTDQSTNGPTSWSWDFGDTGTSALQNPSHDYTGAGDYTVSLTAANAYGQDTETKVDYISVSAAPVAGFVGSPTSGAVPLAVSFTDQSTNSPTSWSWDFGDAGTSSLQNPSHDYTSAAKYTVSLTAANACGQDTETKVDYITATEGGSGDYVADSYTILSGTYVSGGLADTQASDDSYLVVNTVKITGQQSTEIQYSFNTDLTSLSSLSVTQEWRHEGVTTDRRQRTRLYNFTNAGWDEVDNRLVNCTVDTTVVVDVASPSPYISAAGEVRVKLLCGDNGSDAFSHYVDLVKITAAP